MTAELAALAEHGQAYAEPARGYELIVTDRYVMGVGPEPDPAMNVVDRPRLQAGQVDDAVAEVRAAYLARGRTACSWEVGSSSTPADLHQRLVGLGMTAGEEPSMLAMICVRPPPAPEPPVEVRPARSERDLAAVAAIFQEGDGWMPGEAWLRSTDRWLAYLDGEPVATADATFTPRGAFLGGALTVPRARGRGAYRALVRARWDEAMRRGLPGVATQSEPMSQPILVRLGFQVVAEIDVLIDRFDPA